MLSTITLHTGLLLFQLMMVPVVGQKRDASSSAALRIAGRYFSSPVIRYASPAEHIIWNPMSWSRKYESTSSIGSVNDSATARTSSRPLSRYEYQHVPGKKPLVHHLRSEHTSCPFSKVLGIEPEGTAPPRMTHWSALSDAA